MLLAPCQIEGLGLTVLEAMAAALPVVAVGAGGHLETVGAVAGAALHPPGDADRAGELLARARGAPGASRRVRRGAAGCPARPLHARAPGAGDRGGLPGRGLMDLVVTSLEAWDRVWRRNQHLVAGLLRRDPGLRVLFVEPATDPLHAALGASQPRLGRGLRAGPPLDGVRAEALWLLEPTKWLPRRVDRRLDERWARQVLRATRTLDMTDPLLWVNDPHGVAARRGHAVAISLRRHRRLDPRRAIDAPRPSGCLPRSRSC